MRASDASRLRAFLDDTLKLWHVAGAVEAADAPVVAQIRSDTGALAWIEGAPDDAPYRWAVRWRAAGEAPGGTREMRPRTCGSLVGVLAALRTALEVDRGTPVRIAPPAEA